MKRRAALVAALLAMATGPVAVSRAAEPAPADANAATNRLFTDSTLLDRGRISVEVTGSGPDLIFVPGLASSRETWRREALRLRSRYRLHLVQVAGFAGAPAGANGAGPVLEPTAEAIDAYITSAGLAPATYIGHSLGGTMGLYIAEHHPGDLKKVLMVDSLPFYGVLMGGPTATSESLKPATEGIRAAMLKATPEQSAANSGRMAAGMVKDPEGQKEVAAWSARSARPVLVTAMIEDMLLDLRPGLPAVKTPMTLVFPFDAAMGMPSEQWNALYNGQYAALPGLTMVRIDDSRHFVMFDQPTRFETALDAFLAK
jgi:pimeloyl-ACP methyl ester carboxylesterase